MNTEARGHGIYAHFPWCLSRCRYCAFATTARRDPPSQRWAQGVLNEWGQRRDAFPGRAHSLYFGGGTPSLCPAHLLGRVRDALPLQPEAEVTVEVNPGTLRDVDALTDVGVNRVSVGAQTFDDAGLAALGRIHTAQDTRDLAMAIARSSLRSWSIDLIFALPGTDAAYLERDLDRLLALDPPHVSLYGLSFEPGTPLERDRQAGRVRPMDDERWRESYDHLVERLGLEGYDRYEVSNFARPGHRSRHNQATWRGGHYAGLGPAAHGFQPDGRRSVNHAQPERWWADPLGVWEDPTPEQAAIDTILSTLRHKDGLPLRFLERRSGMTLDLRRLAPLVHQGLITVGTSVRLTDPGFALADGVVARLCDALVAACPPVTPTASPRTRQPPP